MLALPHKPQLEDMKTWRVRRPKSTLALSARKTSTTLYWVFREYGLISAIDFELQDRTGQRVLGPLHLQELRTVTNNPDNALTTRGRRY